MSPKLSEQQSRQFQLWLAEKLSPFAVPILIARNEKIEPQGMANGSGCLIQTENWVGVLTCFHVWKHVADIDDDGTMVIVLGDGYQSVRLKKPTLIVSDPAADVAIINLTGIDGLSEKAWFPLKNENLYVPNQGDILVVFGFPGIGRKSVKNRTDFKFGPLPLIVEDVTARSIVIAEPGNSEVFNYFRAHPLRRGMKDPFGGLSGAPAFFVTPNQEIKLAGHVIGTTHGALLLGRISLVTALLDETSTQNEAHRHKVDELQGEALPSRDQFMKKKTSRNPKGGVKSKGYWTPPNSAVVVAAPKPVLSLAEQTELEHLEKVIKGGWKTFLEVGEALAQVRDKGLYKAKYDRFEDYWRIELGYSRSYAYNLIGSAEVNEQLSSIEDIEVKPLNEAQLRELISVPEEKRPEAWKSAVKLAGDKPLTAKIVHKAALKFKPRKSKLAGKAKVKIKKPAPVKPINLGPAMKLLDEAAGMAKGSEDLLTTLKMLREWLQELAAKVA